MIDSWWGASRAEDAQGIPTHSHFSPSKSEHEDKRLFIYLSQEEARRIAAEEGEIAAEEARRAAQVISLPLASSLSPSSSRVFSLSVSLSLPLSLSRSRSRSLALAFSVSEHITVSVFLS